MLQVFLLTFMILILVGFIFIYVNFIASQKRLYDLFRAQGVNGEPFAPFIGQIPQFLQCRNNDALLRFFFEKLVRDHGHV